jgi:dihydroorotate dehydrogenase subfamily 1
MAGPTTFLGKTISGPFTIPSGIVTTQPSIIQRVIKDIPHIGVITTKSIGPGPRPGNREPIYTQYAPGSFVNAVGLTNPGMKKAAQGLAAIDIPLDRFLLVSIFGGSVEEFVDVAIHLAPFADGLELNLSCPHAKGYGMAMGQDPDLVAEIITAVKAAVDVPVIPKLTPNTDRIGEIALAAAKAGADALCAINTVGPGTHKAFGKPVLSNGVGGLSGKGVLAIAQKCIQDIRAVTDLPIIGCGGASSKSDVDALRSAGAEIIGIGSALTGMTTREIQYYFTRLDEASEESRVDAAEALVQYDVDMSFRPVTLERIDAVCKDIALLRFKEQCDIQAGEFVFLWIPGIGEKPFSVLLDDPLTLVAIDVGQFTHALQSLTPGTNTYLRGPYGQAVSIQAEEIPILVAGGTGLAAVYQIARDFKDAVIFVGARSRDRLYFLEECRKIAEVHVATDDGSEGFHGRVTDCLHSFLETQPQERLAAMRFYNCGPEPMVHAAVAVQSRFASKAHIFSAIDYETKCGVGICGACATPDGLRLCVDGPFLNPPA